MWKLAAGVMPFLIFEKPKFKSCNGPLWIRSLSATFERACGKASL